MKLPGGLTIMAAVKQMTDVLAAMKWTHVKIAVQSKVMTKQLNEILG